MNHTATNKTQSNAAHQAAPISINDLVDIRSVTIDPSLPVQEKKRSYLRQIKTPEVYRYDDTIVRISHVNTTITLSDRLKQYLLSKQGLPLT